MLSSRDKTTASRPRIGFIGLGIMGRPMAARILLGGYRLTVHSRTRASAEPVLASGAVWAPSPAAVARASDIIVTMLPDTPDVEAVIFGPNGVAEGCSAGRIVVDMSTIDPTATREIPSRLASAGVDFLDAPVSGGEVGAVNGTLSIMVGGPESVFQTLTPVFDCMGTTVRRVGEHGAGQVAKACNQLVVAGTIQMVAEALTLARNAGVDPAAVRDVLLGGFAASRVLEVHGQRMIDRNFEPGFRIRLHRKDGRIIVDLAGGARSPIPAFAVVAEALESLADDGSGELDHSALVTLLEAP